LQQFGGPWRSPLAGATDGTTEMRIVHQDRHAISHRHHVEFDRMETVRQPAAQCPRRIFRSRGFAAAMRNAFRIKPNDLIYVLE
jgi:hypothetical protein